jgi:hypothetical protein
MGAICFKSNVIEPLRVDVVPSRMSMEPEWLAKLAKAVTEFNAVLVESNIGSIQMDRILTRYRTIFQEFEKNILDEDALIQIKDTLRRIDEIDYINNTRYEEWLNSSACTEILVVQETRDAQERQRKAVLKHVQNHPAVGFVGHAFQK